MHWLADGLELALRGIVYVVLETGLDGASEWVARRARRHSSIWVLLFWTICGAAIGASAGLYSGSELATLRYGLDAMFDIDLGHIVGGAGLGALGGAVIGFLALYRQQRGGRWTPREVAMGNRKRVRTAKEI